MALLDYKIYSYLYQHELHKLSVLNKHPCITFYRSVGEKSLVSLAVLKPRHQQSCFLSGASRSRSISLPVPAS